MFTNALPSELIDVVAVIDPDAYSQATVSSGYADMSDYEALLAVGLVGTIASTGKYDLKFQSNTAATGGSDVSGKAITQLTEASPDDSDKQALINLRGEELTEGHRYVKMVRTLTTAGADEATLLLGLKGGMVPNCLPSEVMAVVATIDPDAYAPGDQSSDWFDTSKFHAFLTIFLVGDAGATVTLSSKLEQAVTSGGAAKDISGKTTAAVDGSGSPSESNVQQTIDLRPEELDMDNDYRWARLTVTGTDTDSPADTTSDYAAVVFGVWPRTGIASDHDLASVDEIV